MNNNRLSLKLVMYKDNHHIVLIIMTKTIIKYTQKPILSIALKSNHNVVARNLYTTKRTQRA